MAFFRIFFHFLRKADWNIIKNNNDLCCRYSRRLHILPQCFPYSPVFPRGGGWKNLLTVIIFYKLKTLLKGQHLNICSRLTVHRYRRKNVTAQQVVLQNTLTATKCLPPQKHPHPDKAYCINLLKNITSTQQDPSYSYKIVWNSAACLYCMYSVHLEQERCFHWQPYAGRMGWLNCWPICTFLFYF